MISHQPMQCFKHHPNCLIGNISSSLWILILVSEAPDLMISKWEKTHCATSTPSWQHIEPNSHQCNGQRQAAGETLDRYYHSTTTQSQILWWRSHLQTMQLRQSQLYTCSSGVCHSHIYASWHLRQSTIHWKLDWGIPPLGTNDLVKIQLTYLLSLT